MENTVKQIEQADEIQLNHIINAVIQRYNALHPDRDDSFLSLSTDPHQRTKELENILRFIVRAAICHPQADVGIRPYKKPFLRGGCS